MVFGTTKSVLFIKVSSFFQGVLIREVPLLQERHPIHVLHDCMHCEYSPSNTVIPTADYDTQIPTQTNVAIGCMYMSSVAGIQLIPSNVHVFVHNIPCYHVLLCNL